MRSYRLSLNPVLPGAPAQRDQFSAVCQYARGAQHAAIRKEVEEWTPPPMFVKDGCTCGEAMADANRLGLGPTRLESDALAAFDDAEAGGRGAASCRTHSTSGGRGRGGRRARRGGDGLAEAAEEAADLPGAAPASELDRAHALFL
eukprot:tig00001208_g7520.t1